MTCWACSNGRRNSSAATATCARRSRRRRRATPPTCGRVCPQERRRRTASAAAEDAVPAPTRSRQTVPVRLPEIVAASPGDFARPTARADFQRNIDAIIHFWRVPSSRLLFAGRSLALVVFEPRLHELVEFLHLFVGVGFWRAVFQPTEHVSFD